jgi:hypothetical protein
MKRSGTVTALLAAGWITMMDVTPAMAQIQAAPIRPAQTEGKVRPDRLRDPRDHRPHRRDHQRPDRPERGERIERRERPDRPERPERAERAAHSARG